MSNNTSQLLHLIAISAFFSLAFVVLLIWHNQYSTADESSRLTFSTGKQVYDVYLFENQFTKVKAGLLSGNSSMDMACGLRCIIIVLDDTNLSIHQTTNVWDKKINSPVVVSDNQPITSITNNSGHSVKYIVIESFLTPFRPDPPGPDGYHARNDAIYQHRGSQLTDLIFEDDHYRIYRLMPSPASGIEVSHRLSGVFISTQSVPEITYKFEDGKTISIDGEENNIWWVNSDRYSIASYQDAADLLFIEFLPVMRYDGYEP